MLRGEVRLVDFAIGLPGEAARRRPAVIVSNDAANTAAARLGQGSITVVPLTSNLSRLYGFQVVIPAADAGVDTDSKAQTELVTTVSVERVRQRLGQLPLPLMRDLDNALRLHLAL